MSRLRWRTEPDLKEHFRKYAYLLLLPRAFVVLG